jgi:hypothetical protein
MSKEKAEANDPLAGGQDQSSQSVTFGKVGDFIKGTYVGKKVVKTSNGEAPLYEVKVQVGRYHAVDGKKNPIEPAVEVQPGAFYSVWGSFKSTAGANAITSMFSRIKLGEVVGIQLQEEIESKTKGNAPFKKFRCLTYGIDPTYMGEDSSSTGSEQLDAARAAGMVDDGEETPF